MIHNAYLPYGASHQNPNVIIVHAMSEYFMVRGKKVHAVEFLNEIRLSAHALISPNGDVFICRSDREGAYHARGHNTDSLGIEFLVEGLNSYSEFIDKIKTDYITEEQMQAGVDVCKKWIDSNDITLVTRHSDVSPERKVDPGSGFDWSLFLSKLGV